jgi:uncharacterized protein DUF6049
VITRVGLTLAALLVVVGAVVGTPADGAAAQETTTTKPGAASGPLPVGLSLVSQDTWVGLGDTFTMNLHIDNRTLANRPGAQISIRVDQSRTSRSSFQEVIDNGDPGDTIFSKLITVSSLLPDAQGDVPIIFGLSNSGVGRDRTIGITHPGVYPVVVQLVNTGVASGSFVTWLVVVDMSTPNPIDKKLSVAFVAQAVANPIKLPSGRDDPKVVASMKAGGRLDKIATLLAANPAVRTSLVVSPETAVAWRRLALRDPAFVHSFSSIRAAVTRQSTEVLPSPYVPIDAASLDAAGLGTFLEGEYDQGGASMRTAFGVNPAASAQAAFIDPVPTTDAVIDGLRGMVIDRVAVRAPALIPVHHQFSPVQAFVLDTAAGDESRGVETAPYLEDLLEGRDPGALRAQRVIASLAEIAYEQPAIARGVVIAPPERWNPDLRTMQTIFSALRTMPLVQSATLDDLFATVTNEQALGTTVQRRLAPGVPVPAPVDPTQYLTTASELAAFSNVVGADDPVVVRGRAALLTTLSTSMTPERVRSELDQIDVAVRAFTAGVRADEKRITLTSRSAQVPLTFENNLKPARPVTVRVHLDSAKMLFPKGADRQLLLKPGSSTVRFDVEARASGTFPMTITVTSPDGRLQFGAPVQVTVRSAVFGGWAVGLTVAALVFLAGWWANHFRRTRKSRRVERQSPAPAPAPTPAT